MLLLETVAKEERHRTYANDVCYQLQGDSRLMTFDEFQEFARKNWSMSVEQVRVHAIVIDCGLDSDDELWYESEAEIVVEIIPV
jgi:hypothetical protein